MPLNYNNNNNAKTLFYAPPLFLKKWALIKEVCIKNDVTVRRKQTATDGSKPARGSVN